MDSSAQADFSVDGVPEPIRHWMMDELYWDTSEWPPPGPVDLDQLVLSVPGVAGDVAGDLVGLGGQVAVGVVGVGELIVLQQTISVVDHMQGRKMGDSSVPDRVVGVALRRCHRSTRSQLLKFVVGEGSRARANGSGLVDPSEIALREEPATSSARMGNRRVTLIGAGGF